MGIRPGKVPQALYLVTTILTLPQKDGNYIIIKKWVSDDVQQDMFEHTRQIRQRKAITAGPVEIERETRLYVNDKKKDKMYMVRKKSPNRRSWILS